MRQNKGLSQQAMLVLLGHGCDGGVDYIKRHDNSSTAWGMCDRSDWMLWALEQLALNRRQYYNGTKISIAQAMLDSLDRNGVALRWQDARMPTAISSITRAYTYLGIYRDYRILRGHIGDYPSLAIVRADLSNIIRTVIPSIEEYHAKLTAR